MWQICTFLTFVGLTACASPAERFDREATSLGLRAETVSGDRFSHKVYRHASREATSSRVLHVYLEGDGSPMRAGRPARDPTPRNPLALHLAALDSGDAIYVGRPCYHGLARSPGCAQRLWTADRYSEAVVGSLAAAIRRLRRDTEAFERIAWFGYSGGGTLAMLLAERFPETQSVVTVAANLDTEAWTRSRDFRPLTGSLNPAARPPLPESVIQRHYAGSRDEIVPPEMTARGLRGAQARLTVVEGYDHVCCWEELWPAILAELERVAGDAGPGDGYKLYRIPTVAE